MRPASRSPVHVVYGGAHLFRADTAPRLGAIAREALLQYAPAPKTFAGALKISGVPIPEIYRRVVDKLRREPVEDYRIDFEDGFGERTDEEEDRYARSTARETAAGMAEGTLPPMIGIRLKPLTGASRPRALRTLELYLTALAEEAGNSLPEHFVITLPKVTRPAQVAECAGALGRLESALRLPATIEMEFMAETPEALMDSDGRCPIPSFIAAAGGRCTAVHFGPYDYTAALGIAGAEQRLDHPACDAARSLLQLACAGTGVRISDGPVNLLPIPPHRPEKRLSPKQAKANRSAILDIWRRNYALVARSLQHGFYQGWDLHPLQLPVRYAAVYAFFMEHLDAQARRLRSFAGQAARISVVDSLFDDAATGRGLMNFFRRGISCGAFTPTDLEGAGLDPAELGPWPDTPSGQVEE